METSMLPWQFTEMMLKLEAAEHGIARLQSMGELCALGGLLLVTAFIVASVIGGWRRRPGKCLDDKK
uniref:Uncharacterized protein n=1 Tax=viral metagenome TaxID=1070528 RepID=A0A6M3L8X9_9ZZZZ